MTDNLACNTDQKISPCVIHPDAKEILFENRRAVSKVFRDVIGLCELDHVSIAIINHANEIIFLSSTPSLEYNLIESGLWAYDSSFHPDFYKSNHCIKWENLYLKDHYHDLRLIKQTKPAFKVGISIAKTMGNNHLVYSFATRSRDCELSQNLLHQGERLLQIGQYCLHKLTKIVPFATPYPHLQLVKNTRMEK